MKNQNNQDFTGDLPSGEACLVLKDGQPYDVANVKNFIKKRSLQVLREHEFIQPNGLHTLAVYLPPQSLHDLILELAAKGVGGELVGYEVNHNPVSRFNPHETNGK